MNEAKRSRVLPAARPKPDDDLLRRHRDALKETFPIPDAAALKPRQKAKRALAGLALGAGMLGALWWIDPAYRHDRYATATGRREEVALPDGSRVTLDAATRLDVFQRLRSRDIVLQAGHALFQVVPSPGRPFRVEAGDVRVEDLDTLFDVQRYSDGVAVTVAEGRVAVASPGRAGLPLTLAANQRLVVRRDGAGPVAIVDADAYASWTRGQLVFDRTPLAEVVEELQRYRAAPLVLADPALGRLQVSGVFDSRRGADIVAMLPQILPVKVRMQADGASRIEAR